MKNEITDLLPLLWDHVENKKAKNKLAQKVYDFMNYDNINAIPVEKEWFYIEPMASYITIPNYIYKYIIAFGKKNGFTYLYDIK
jgi:hypothetical protein